VEPQQPASTAQLLATSGYEPEQDDGTVAGS
jgi:hypothetical protein